VNGRFAKPGSCYLKMLFFLVESCMGWVGATSVETHTRLKLGSLPLQHTSSLFVSAQDDRGQVRLKSSSFV